METYWVGWGQWKCLFLYEIHNTDMSMSDLSWMHIPEMYAGLSHREIPAKCSYHTVTQQLCGQWWAELSFLHTQGQHTHLPTLCIPLPPSFPPSLYVPWPHTTNFQRAVMYRYTLLCNNICTKYHTNFFTCISIFFILVDIGWTPSSLFWLNIFPIRDHFLSIKDCIASAHWMLWVGLPVIHYSFCQVGLMLLYQKKKKMYIHQMCHLNIRVMIMIWMVYHIIII